MKLNAIKNIHTPKFIKNLAIATPLLLSIPLVNALEKSPNADRFEKENVKENFIPVNESDEYSPEIKVGNKTVYPAIVVDKSENQLYFYDLDGGLDTLFSVGFAPSDISFI